MSEAALPVGETGEFLRTELQTTTAGQVHTEAVMVVDPDNVDAKQQVTDTTPAADAYGAVVRIAGSVATTPSGTQNVNVTSSVLPTGAATEAKQDAANALLTSIDVDTLQIVTNTAATVSSLGDDGGTPPPFGTGVRGWLRSIWTALKGNTLNLFVGPSSLIPYSSTTPLGVSATMPSTSWIPTSGFAQLNLSVFSDVASAVDGCIIEWSDDGTNVHDNDLYTIPAGNGQTLKFGASSWRFVRFRYINGTTAQTVFRFTSILLSMQQKSSTHRIADRVNGQQDADLVEAVIKGAGTYQIAAGASGAVNVPEGAWIIGISATSPTTGNGTITGIPGQTGTVTLIGSIAKTSAKNINPPLGTCIAAVGGSTITFTGTDSYEVEYLVV